jgi:RNA polymerase sigma factor (sigma-70 family)
MADDVHELDTLVQRIREGSEDAVRELIERYGSHIMHVIYRRLDRRLRAKLPASDFLQDVWVSFICNPTVGQTFKTPEELFSFLMAMAYNKVSDATRRGYYCQKHGVARERSLDGSFHWVVEDMPAPGPTPSEAVADEEQWERLLEGRPLYQQQILRMLRQGYTHAEIARALDVSEKTVQRLIQRLSMEFGSS